MLVHCARWSPAAAWKARRTVGKSRGIFSAKAAPIFSGSLREAGPWTANFSARVLLRTGLLMAFPLALVLAGCGGGIRVAADSAGAVSSNGSFSISPGAVTIDTNCTGCNKAGSGYEQFTATTSGGAPASVTWSVTASGTGGGNIANAGAISASGRYTPPPYLMADKERITVTAALKTNPGQTASETMTVTPGFLQPLSPVNVALGANGTVTVTGYIAEVGGTDGIDFSVSGTPAGAGGLGSLVPLPCTRGNAEDGSFTYCSAIYTAPAAISGTTAAYIVATISGTGTREEANVLLNTQGVTSNPAAHQAQQATPVLLGSSGGNNSDYDTTAQGGQTYISDCCGGTLGSLIQDASGNQYILSNNHVLARSDQASIGETIIQPGLIDNDPACAPEGDGGNETPVGVLKGFVPIQSSSTNVDAAIASVNSGAVNASGAILELGSSQTGGTLAAAPPGVSSTGGKGENPALGMTVAKSGRTTGLTCARISAVALRVEVSYYANCAETDPYYTKTYTNQIGMTGDHFIDAGDSGSLIVDSSDAEPVGLFFAGGVDSAGQSEGVANPAPEVLSELKTYVANNSTSYTWVGTTDHPVSCLDYGSGAAADAQSRSLSGAQLDRAQSAMMDARSLVNSSSGVLGVAAGKSSDRPGEAAIVVYVDQSKNPSIPATIDGVRTAVIPATARSVAMGAAPLSLAQAGARTPLSAAVLHQAIGIEQRVASSLMKQTPAFFGVGVGQSLDDPAQAALVIYVDQNQVPAELPQTVDGLRTRYIVMERMHVTRAYLSATPWHSRCMAHATRAPKSRWDSLHLKKPLRRNLH